MAPSSTRLALVLFVFSGCRGEVIDGGDVVGPGPPAEGSGQGGTTTGLAVPPSGTGGAGGSGTGGAYNDSMPPDAAAVSTDPPPTGGPPDAGPAPAPSAADPFTAAPACTSGTMWTMGTHGSQQMQPGEACITCHSKGKGPQLAFGGTVFATGHEPSECNGASGPIEVTVTDAAGVATTVQVNQAGNFLQRGRMMLPLKAKVVSGGRERAMAGSVMSGDCNSCHTQAGTTTAATGLKAPGRIVAP